MRRVKTLKLYFIVMLFIVFLIYSAFGKIKMFFMATLDFNIPIVTLLFIGMLILYQGAVKLTMLAGTFGTLAYKKGKDLEYYLEGISSVLPATIAHMFQRRAKKGVLFFTDHEANEVIHWLESQFHQQKGYSAFFVGTLLTLGLLGTFSGLLIALDEMGKVILSFGGDNVDIGDIMTGFSGPLSGMAIGFAASLFGVSSAILLNLMQYILTRSQDAFIEDVQGWLKGKILESQSVESLEQIQGTGEFGSLTKSNNLEQGGQLTSGFIDVFIDSMSNFADKMDKTNKASEEAFLKVATKLEQSFEKTGSEAALLKNVLEVMKETNVNQFSNAKMIEESLQEISTVIMSEHKTIKKSLEIQEENNRLLVELINNLKK